MKNYTEDTLVVSYSRKMGVGWGGWGGGGGRGVKIWSED